MAEKKIIVQNGIIDEDYDGEIFVVLSNITTNAISLSRGTKICQGVVYPISPCIHEYEIVSGEIRDPINMMDDHRRESAFGSSGDFCDASQFVEEEIKDVPKELQRSISRVDLCAAKMFLAEEREEEEKGEKEKEKEPKAKKQKNYHTML